jgi:hypothetical protein
MRKWTALVLVASAAAGVLASGAGAQTRPPQQPLRVMIISHFTLADLARYERRGAVGLLVPGVGPTVNRRQALAALVRGAVENARMGGVPSGPPIIGASAVSGKPTGEPLIIVALPPKGRPILNDRRYPIAVVGRGYHGLLLSRTTRIPGVVSVVDIAPTATGRAGKMLLSRPTRDAAGVSKRLAARIDANNQLKLPALIAVLVLVGFLGLLRPRAALPALPAALLGNLVLGIVGPTSVSLLIGSLVVATVAGGLALERVCRTENRLLALLALVLISYLVAMAVDPTWVAINPLGPTQNSRFFGIGNQVETLLLAPVLAGAALAGRRFGPLGFIGFGALGLVTVADNSFGADGGGAIVLAVGLAVLGSRLARFRGRGLATLLAAGAAAVLALIRFDERTGAPNHLQSAFSNGFSGFLEVARNRVPLAYEPAFHQWPYVGPFLLAFAVVAVVALRGRQTPGRRDLLLATVAALAASLLVNDSVAYELVGGVATLVAVGCSRFAYAPLRRPAIANPFAVPAPQILVPESPGE